MYSTIFEHIDDFEQIGCIKHNSIFIIQNKKTMQKYVQMNAKNKINESFFKNIIFSNHPSILPLKTFQMQNQDGLLDSNFPSFYSTIITEYMQNDSLQKMIDENRLNDLTDTQKYIILIGILNAMRFIHLNDFYDLKLKPSKILLDENFYPHILINDYSKNGGLFKDKDLLFKELKLQFLNTFYELIIGKPTNYDNNLEKIDFSKIQKEWIREFIQKYYKNPAEISESFEMYNKMIENMKEFGNIQKDEVDKYLNIINQHENIFVKNIKKLTNDNNFEAIYIYGKILYYGFGVDVNKDEATTYFLRASDSGISDASIYYSKCLQLGQLNIHNTLNALCYILKGFNQEIENKKQLLKKEVDENDSDSLLEYATFLLELESKSDNKEGIEYLKKAVDLENADAMYKYATMINNGEISDVDHKDAEFYLKKAADLGHSDAINNYAVMKKDGIGIPKDSKEALIYFKKGIEKNNILSTFNYGLMLYLGEGIEKNVKEANQYFEKAASKGDYSLKLTYAILLYGDEELNIKHKEEAAKYFKEAADLGNNEAMNRYGLMLRDGDGIPQDKAEAIKYFKKAIDNNFAPAMHNYGFMLLSAKETEKEGIRLIKMAADKGMPVSMFVYGVILREGIVVLQDYKQALYFFKKSLENECELSKEVFKKMIRLKQGIPDDKNDAKEYYKLYAAIGDKDDIFQFALMLYTGDNLEKNIKEALIYFKKAADLGQVQAMNNCAEILRMENEEDVETNQEESDKYFEMAIDHQFGISIYNYAKVLEKENNPNATKYYSMFEEINNSDELYKYGKMISKGEIISNNKDDAIKYYQKAAELGHIESMVIYGKILIENKENIENTKRAIEYFKKGIEKENAESMYLLAEILYDQKNEDGQNENTHDAIDLYKNAAERGNVEAMYKYGLILCLEKDQNNKYDQGLEYLKKAADNWNQEAQISYLNQLKIKKSQIYKQEKLRYLEMRANNDDYDALLKYVNKLVKQLGENDYKVIKYYKKLADLGNENAMLLYGLALENGEGIQMDKQEAIRYYQLASNKGQPNAMFRYALLLSNGDGIPKDMKKAAELYEKAAYLGNGGALNNWAVMLKNGDGVEMNKDLALRLFKINAISGHSISMLNYGRMLLSGEGTLKNAEEAAIYIKKSADNGCPESMFLIAVMFEKGEGLPMNIKEAIKYYKMAIENNNEKAKSNLIKLSHSYTCQL